MKIIFWGKGDRGIHCLQGLYKAGYKIDLLIGQQREEDSSPDPLMQLGERLKIKTTVPDDPNKQKFIQLLKQEEADLFILAGYGKILTREVISIPKKMCINLHAGKLPQYRGSSPLNWALIHGETSVTLSIIKVDTGVDTGEILMEQSFEAAVNDTIVRLHEIANTHFPRMLVKALQQIEKGTCQPVPQDSSSASYFSLRFPDDGFIVWDLYTAEQIHNRIRALTDPYPNAFTLFHGNRVKLRSSELCRIRHMGEPGRVYRKTEKNGLLVGALDQCLWIKEAFLVIDGRPLKDVISRYDQLITVRGTLLGGEGEKFPHEDWAIRHR